MSEDLTPQSPESLVEQEAPAKPVPGGDEHGVIRFYSHSQLFYYWPLWLISYVFALITYISGKSAVVTVAGQKAVTFKVYPAPGLGLAYLIILICVILFTSVNVRGVWAALVAATIVITGLVFNLLNWWKPILNALGGLNFFLNYHFYLTVGVVLSILWVAIFFLYDRRHYIEFRPTQLTIVEEVGKGEKNFDTMGLVFDKQRDNFFQHLLLGFGSGDLVIKTHGGDSKQIFFPNVLRIGARIEQLHKLREQRGR